MPDWREAGRRETAGSPGVAPVFHAAARYSDDLAMATTAITPTSTRPVRGQRHRGRRFGSRLQGDEVGTIPDIVAHRVHNPASKRGRRFRHIRCERQNVHDLTQFRHLGLTHGTAAKMVLERRPLLGIQSVENVCSYLIDFMIVHSIANPV